MPINDLTGVPIYADKNDAKEKLSPRIKQECERRILEVMPEWRQRNTIADLTSDDADTKAVAAVEWAKVTALRTKSNEIEASILSMTDEQIVNFEAFDDAHWS
tara:strand:+ start:56 stop:364 length:309 start_codon:yes stop_codon:yes gene_type:complete